MSKSVHFKKPKRRKQDRIYSGEFGYQNYRDDLREDFHTLCCYCGKSELIYATRKRKFTIEHIKPKKKFDELRNTYNNLSFCCDTCNGKKGETWPTDDELSAGKYFVDVADEEQNYDNHLIRDDFGNIIPLTDTGKYMYNKLGFKYRPLDIIYENTVFELINKYFEEQGFEKYSKLISEELGMDDCEFLKKYREIRNRLQKVED